MRRTSWRVRSATVAALALGAAGWLQPLTAQATTADSFSTYTGSTPLADIAPGTVLKTRTQPYKLTGFKLPLQVTQILYRTVDSLGRPKVNVTSVIKTPTRATTDKVISYGSFYDSLNPKDSPSVSVDGGHRITNLVGSLEVALVSPFLAQGYDVVIADTQGRTADFGAGPEYGMTTLDSIRAVLNAPTQTGVTSAAKFGLVGYSGGAIATGWASALAPAYAPELADRLVGTAEGGIMVDPAHNLDYVSGSALWAGILPMAIVGIARSEDIDLTPYLNARGIEINKRLQTQGITNVLGQYAGVTWAKLAKPQFSDPEKVPVYVQVVNKLNLGSRPSPTLPMFMGAGANGLLEGTKDSAKYGAGDGVMIAGDVRSLARQYCAAGTAVTYHEYPGTSHFLSVPQWLLEAIPWMTARFAGTAAPQNCSAIKPGNSLAPVPMP